MAKKNKLMETVLGETSSIKGDLEVAHGITIGGTFSGTLKSGGKVIIGKKGKIDADIEAEEVITAGFINGDIKAINKLVVHNKGKVEGNVKTSSLVLEKGGIINGSIDMGVEKKKEDKKSKNEGKKSKEKEPTK